MLKEIVQFIFYVMHVSYAIPAISAALSWRQRVRQEVEWTLKELPKCSNPENAENAESEIPLFASFFVLRSTFL